MSDHSIEGAIRELQDRLTLAEKDLAAAQAVIDKAKPYLVHHISCECHYHQALKQYHVTQGQPKKADV